MITIQNPYRFGGGGDVSDLTPTLAYSLRIFYGWSNANFYARRDSDNAHAYVFFDGSGEISLSSLISTTSPTTPDATTLGAWAGSETVTVETWYGQNSTDIIDHFITNIATNRQPTLIDSGVLNTLNGRVVLLFDGNYLIGDPLPMFGNGIDSTIFTVASIDTPNTLYGFWSTRGFGGSTAKCYRSYIDRRASNISVEVRGTTLEYASLISQVDSSDVRLQSFFKTSSTVDFYYNGAAQNNVSWTETTRNNDVWIIGGINATSSGILFGSVHEFLLYDSLKTSERVSIESDINTRYSIF